MTTSQSSHQSEKHKLARTVVHEYLYVYAADKKNGGMALAEKWRLSLKQPNSSSKHSVKSGHSARVVTTGIEAT